MTEPIDGRQLMRELTPRQSRASVALETALGIEDQTLLPSLTEYIDYIRSSKRIEIYGPTPEFRFIESDQNDPAGQFRFQGTGGSFLFSKALTANWATTQDLMSYDRTNKVWLFNAPEDNSWYIELLAGVAGTSGTNAAIFVNAHATAPFVDLRTGNAGGGSLISRLLVRGGTGSPDIDITTATLDLNGNVAKGFATMRGEGTSDIFFRANKAITDATARRIGLWVLDPATDTEYTVANAVPDAAVPKFTMAAPDDAPSTSELDDGHITFGYTKSTNTLTVYCNEGGAVVSLALGVLA